MKVFLLLFLYCFTINTISAQLTRIELNHQELEYLATDYKSKLSPSEQDFCMAIKNRLISFEFAIIYNDTTLYIGTIDKPNYTKKNYHNIRRYVSFCLPYDSLDTFTKLEILENDRLNLFKTEDGSKFFWVDDYELFSYNSQTKDLQLNDKIASKITIKFYKIVN